MPNKNDLGLTVAEHVLDKWNLAVVAPEENETPNKKGNVCSTCPVEINQNAGLSNTVNFVCSSPQPTMERVVGKKLIGVG